MLEQRGLPALRPAGQRQRAGQPGRRQITLKSGVGTIVETGSDNRAPVRALGQQRPVQRAQRGVNPVEVAAPVCREETVGQADLVDGEPGIALQVHGHPFL